MIYADQRATPSDEKPLQFHAWKDQLLKTGADLYDVAASTENEFLYVGAKLNEFYGRASEISRMSSSLINFMSGEEITSVIGGFQALVDRMSGYLDETEAEFKHGIDTLQDILGFSSAIHKPIAGFKKIVKTLKILSISTKIESAQLDRNDDGFVTIAEDVEKLSSRIDARFKDILNGGDSLVSVVGQTLPRVFGLETKQRDEAQSILDKARLSIASLDERNKSSLITASRISAELDTTVNNMAEIVASMQFHDITRQQVQHVKEALEAICSRLDHGLNISGTQSSCEKADLNGIIIDASTVCELQNAQLADTENNFATAVGNISANLKNVASNIFRMYQDVKSLAGVEGETSSSCFSTIEEGVSSAILSLKDIREAVRELSGVTETLTDTIDHMSTFMSDIEAIGSEIELIAVNARIKAAQTGSEGAPLGIIAEAIQKLSVDARIQKTEIWEELERIVSTAQALHRSVSSSAEEHTAETDYLLKDLDALLDRLHGINDGVLSLLAGIQKEAKTLTVDIERSASGIKVQHDFLKEATKAKSVLSSIVSTWRELLPGVGAGPRSDMLKHLEGNYTMRSERDIHNSYSTPRQPEALADSLSGADGHFGDNVELF